MDRLSWRHVGARVDLPRSIEASTHDLDGLDERLGLPPVASFCIGLMGFVGGGFAIIATASLLALSIN